MALEKELKYRDADHEAVRANLQSEGARPVGRWFESNMVFDTPGRELKAVGKLLRLRLKGDRAVLTVKVPPGEAESDAVKVFEEHETPVGDFDAMRDCLEALGYRVAFAYEKVREKWLLGDCAICLDTLPFGFFVEVEGEEDQIVACAARLGLEVCKSCTLTYHALNLEMIAEKGLPEQESFVFDSKERARLIEETQT